MVIMLPTVKQFYAADGIGKFQSADIYSAMVQQNNPLFYDFDVNAYNYTQYPTPVGSSSFRLQTGSSGLGKANTTAVAYNTVTTTGITAQTLLRRVKTSVRPFKILLFSIHCKSAGR